jgi:hypothetical protein
MEGRVGLAGRRRLLAMLRLLPLLVAVVAAAWVRYELMPAHHAMYVDEPWYAEAACNLSRRGALQVCQETWSGTVCEPYAKAIGWPLLLSLVAATSGCDASVGIAVNRLLGTATVALLGVTAMAAGATAGQGAFAAAILAVHPVHGEWSATGETNVAAAFALLAGLCGAILYRRGRGAAPALLAAAALGGATAIRPELLLAALAIAAGLAAAVELPARRRLAVAAAIAVASALAALSALPLWAMNADISGGGFLSLANVPAALGDIGRAGGWPVHGAVAALAGAGLWTMARRGDGWPAMLLLTAALAAAVVALAYERFAERMLLSATVALLPAAARACDWLAPPAGAGMPRRWLRPLAEAAALALLLQVWRAPLQAAALPPETQLLETRLVAGVARRAVPDGALLIAEQPTVLAAAGLARVMSTREALRDLPRLGREIAAGRSVYFLSDMFCEPDFAGGDAAERCARLRREFAGTAVVEERLHGRRYALLRLSSPRRR